jgi:hypothetical protein
MGIVARLMMRATSADAIAAPAGRRPSHIVVSVIDEDGEPVTGLASGHFSVGPSIVGSAGSPVLLAGVSPGDRPGTYNIALSPAGSGAPRKGVYFFTVAASAGPDSGQTLATVLMD